MANGEGWFRRLATYLFWAVGAIGTVATTYAYVSHPHHPGAVWWLVTALGIVAVWLLADVAKARWSEHQRKERVRRLQESPEISGETIFLWELIAPGARPIVSDRTFRNCTINGPGLVTFIGNTEMVAVTLAMLETGGDPEQVMFESPSTPHVKQGLVAFVHCKFSRCKFVGLGFYGERSMLDRLKNVPRV